MANNPSLNYEVVVQVPVPFGELLLGPTLAANFDLPAVLNLNVPPAVKNFVANAQQIVQNIIDDANDLIQAIPEITVTIVFIVGDVVVYSVQLVAQPTPVDVPIPNFQLDLNDIGVSTEIAGSISVTLPTIAPPPTVIGVPVPVPNFTVAPGQTFPTRASAVVDLTYIPTT